MVQGMQQLGTAADSKLIQNDQRNATQEGVITGLFAATRKITNQMEKAGKNYQGNQLTNQKVTAAENKWQEFVRPRKKSLIKV